MCASARATDPTSACELRPKPSTGGSKKQLSHRHNVTPPLQIPGVNIGRRSGDKIACRLTRFARGGASDGDERRRNHGTGGTRAIVRATATVPLLRRTHAHHRGVRAWRDAETSAITETGADEDRHVMSATSRSVRRIPKCWSSAGNGVARADRQANHMMHTKHHHYRGFGRPDRAHRQPQKAPALSAQPHRHQSNGSRAALSP